MNDKQQFIEDIYRELVESIKTLEVALCKSNVTEVACSVGLRVPPRKCSLYLITHYYALWL